MTTILDTLKNTADEEKAATALAAFARENPEALETIIKANQLFLEKFALSGGENLYNAYRETARAYKKKNLIQSNYPYDSQNYAEAAAYYLKAAEPSIVTAETEYGTLIHASVEKDNVFACQFHPEKSSSVGLSILKNFISLT